MTTRPVGERVTLDHIITIEATPPAIFPLLCPVREGEWLDGWVGRPIFSQSGYAEENGVFATEHAGESDTIWFVTMRDPATYRIEFVVFIPQLQVFRLHVQVNPGAAGTSTIGVRYIRTGLSDAGNEAVRASAARFNAVMTNWERTMNHFLKTGTMLPTGRA